MIKSLQDILHLLNEYINIDSQNKSDMYSYISRGEYADKQSAKRQIMYDDHGIVIGRLLEGDNATIQTLKMGVLDEALRCEMHKYCARENKTPKVIDKVIDNDLQTVPIDKLLEKYCPVIKLPQKVINLPYSDKKVLLFLYFAFENYKSMPESPYNQSPYNPDISYLTEEYQNIFNKQSQFGKYGLVPIDQDRTLLLIDSPRIYDKLLNKTFYTKNIPLGLLKQFSDMLSNGLINNLAVRLKNEPGYNGYFRGVCLNEELERGESFSLADLGNYSISKLYSIDNYKNKLWVVIDPQNITFEEFCEEIVIYNKMMVTQVVHLQYENIEGGSYITHLDHEYVFYTQDEYDKRQDDVKQKGEAQKRLKSFKIDNSKIPFTFCCEVYCKDENGNDSVKKEQFLCYVLECYFKHKDLLSEYFQKVKA